MMNEVVVATYEHKHGTDIRVFSTLEGAEAWREEIAREYWERCGFSEDIAFDVDLYLEEIGDFEWFNYEFYEVEGA